MICIRILNRGNPKNWTIKISFFAQHQGKIDSVLSFEFVSKVSYEFDLSSYSLVPISKGENMNYELLPKQAFFLLFVVLMLSSQHRLRVLRHNLNIHLMNGMMNEKWKNEMNKNEKSAWRL